MSVDRSEEQEPRPQVHKIVLDLDDWSVSDSGREEDRRDRRATVTIDGAKLARAIQEAANKHDHRKTYANGAFTVEVSK